MYANRRNINKGIWTIIECCATCQSVKRSTEGLRISLRSESDWSRAVNAAKLKLGRRVYFRTSEIVKVLIER